MADKKEIKAKMLFVPNTIGKPSVAPKEWDEFNDQQKEAIGEHIFAKFVLGAAEMGIKMPGYKVAVIKDNS